jgi:hypothetical protein
MKAVSTAELGGMAAGVARTVDHDQLRELDAADDRPEGCPIAVTACWSGLAWWRGPTGTPFRTPSGEEGVVSGEVGVHLE